MTTYHIITLWAQALAADEDLNNWVAAHCPAPLTIFVGMDTAQEPGRETAPYIAMHPTGDMLGPEAEAHRYGVCIYLGLETTAEPATTGAVITQQGLRLMEQEFAPRVMRCLAATEYPPLTGEGITHLLRAGYCERDINVTYSEDTVLGETGWG